MCNLKCVCLGGLIFTCGLFRGDPPLEKISKNIDVSLPGQQCAMSCQNGLFSAFQLFVYVPAHTRIYFQSKICHCIFQAQLPKFSFKKTKIKRVISSSQCMNQLALFDLEVNRCDATSNAVHSASKWKNSAQLHDYIDNSLK